MSSELEDETLVMRVKINRGDEKRLKKELYDWWECNSVGMGRITFSREVEI